MSGEPECNLCGLTEPSVRKGRHMIRTQNISGGGFQGVMLLYDEGKAESLQTRNLEIQEAIYPY